MSAKITVIVYILISFEVGILLMILPWKPYWEDNFFLYYITSKLNAAWLPTLLTSGYVKGAVTGIGALNVLAGLRDLFKFRESVNALVALSQGENHPISDIESRSGKSDAIESRSNETDAIESRPTKPGTPQTVALSDHRPPGIPPQS